MLCTFWGVPLYNAASPSRVLLLRAKLVPFAQHALTATRWEAQLKGMRAVQGLLDRFLSAPAQQGCLCFLEASLHHCFVCALEVVLVEELRGLSFGSGTDTAWVWRGKTEELKEGRDRWVFPLSLLPGGLTREKKPKQKSRLSAILCAFNEYFLKI